MNLTPAHLVGAGDASNLLPPGLAWLPGEVADAPCLMVNTTMGCMAAVWPNEARPELGLREHFTWHTFDEDGIGGDNAVNDTLDVALAEAWKALVRQGWTEPLVVAP